MSGDSTASPTFCPKDSGTSINENKNTSSCFISLLLSILHTGLEMFRDIEVTRQPVFVFPIFVKRIKVLDRPNLVSNRLSFLVSSTGIILETPV